MGAQVSEEVERWVSAADLTYQTRKMRVIPALPAECQVQALKKMWHSLRWVSAGEAILGPQARAPGLILIVRGEAQAILGCTQYMPLLPEGAFVCEAALLSDGASEGDPYSIPGLLAAGGGGPSGRRPRGNPAWPLRRWHSFPEGLLSVIQDFLVKRRSTGPRFDGQLRATRRSLIAELTREEYLLILDWAEDQDAVRDLRGGGDEVPRNPLQNVVSLDARARALGSEDIAALRVVCDGPMNISCRGPALPALRAALPQIDWNVFASCRRPAVEGL